MTRHGRWGKRPTVIGAAGITVVAAVAAVWLTVAPSACSERTPSPTPSEVIVGTVGVGSDKVGPSEDEANSGELPEAPLTGG